MADDTWLRRTYRYRIYPTVRLRLALEAQFGFACQLYNAALEERRYAWRGRHRAVTLYEQFRELTAVGAGGAGAGNMYFPAMRGPSSPLDTPLSRLFRRVTHGGHPAPHRA